MWLKIPGEEKLAEHVIRLGEAKDDATKREHVLHNGSHKFRGELDMARGTERGTEKDAAAPVFLGISYLEPGILGLILLHELSDDFALLYVVASRVRSVRKSTYWEFLVLTPLN